MKRKSILITILITIFLTNMVYAKPYHDYFKKQANTAPAVAYKIKLPGKQNEDGTYSPAKIIDIPKLTPENYYRNIIHIKTKTLNNIKKGNKSLSSSGLSAMLLKYEVEKIRAPFEEYQSPKLSIIDKQGIGRILEVRYKANYDPYEVCKELMQSPELEYAVPVFIDKISEHVPNDPLLKNQWAINKLQLKDAWDISKGDKSILIAIVDSGVDWEHEDLADNIWTNPDEIAGNKIDDDGNGKVDDIRGWDLVGNISVNDAWYGNWDEDADPKNISGTHGTHVAGCATAVTNNGIGVAGPGYNCSILPVKCGIDQGGRSIYRGYDGIAYAAATGADIINCSWSGPGYSPAAQDVINQAVSMGCLVVVAAGNEGNNLEVYTEYPAGYDNVLCVGSTSSNDNVSSFSNYGNQVTVYSPGDGIRSTMPSNKYQNQSGTSMASPVTAGVAGLVLALHPDWEPIQVMQQLRSSSDNVLADTDEERERYFGRLNAYNAVSNNYGPGTAVPGIAISDVQFTEGDAIDSYDATKIIITVKNYLANATNVKATITSLDGSISLSLDEVNLGTITTSTEKKIELNVTLKQKNPWYLGTSSIMLTFESGDYINYERINLPIEIDSENDYTLYESIPEDYIPQWHSAASTGSNNLWALGYGVLFNYKSGVYWKNGASATTYVADTQSPLFCLAAIDDTTAFAGGGNISGGDRTEVYKTENGGKSWTSNDVGDITNFINGIAFYDDTDGIFLGDPSNGKWGIGITSNGGETWTGNVNCPAPLSGEAGWAGSYYFYEQSAWFGTNKGQIYYSTNRGIDWQAASIEDAVNISLIAFRDEMNGIAVYTESEDQNSTEYLAVTNNGGVSWSAKTYNLTANSMYPEYLFTADYAEKVYMLCNAGEIYETSDGVNFSAVLSEKHGIVLTGTASNYELGKVVLWNIGREIATLEFDYNPSNAKKEIIFADADLFDFDSLMVDDSKDTVIYVENTGNMTVNISEISIVPGASTEENEFDIRGIPVKSIDAGETKEIKIRFRPAGEGLRAATLQIESDADERILEASLQGTGLPQVSVNDLNQYGFAMYNNVPNPCSDATKFTFELKYDSEIDISIIDETGTVLLENGPNIFEAGTHDYFLATSSFAPGVYYFRLKSNGKMLMKKFVVVR